MEGGKMVPEAKACLSLRACGFRTPPQESATPPLALLCRVTK